MFILICAIGQANEPQDSASNQKSQIVHHRTGRLDDARLNTRTHCTPVDPDMQVHPDPKTITTERSP